MAQRYDIVKIDFQANAAKANAAIESLRVQAEKCNEKVKQLRNDLKEGIKMGKSAEEIEKIRVELNAAAKDTNVWSKAYNELIKGMRVFDQGVKAFNDGTLPQMSAAFQKTLYNATKLIQSKLDPALKEHKESWRQLQALMDASQQNYARLQGDAAKMIQTLKEGGAVSRQALSGELQAQKELLQVLSATDKGYQQTVRNVAVLDNYLRAMGGDYQFIRENMSDTKKISDDTLRNMYSELEKVNQEGKVTKEILRENATMMREIRTEQARRVQNVLGGDLGKQSEGSIRAAIANAKELMITYGSTSKKAQELAAQIVNAEEHLKQHGIEGVRAAKREAEAVQLLNDKHKMMSDRMSNLRNLSAGAITETQRYWQAQMDGATRSSKAYKEAERNLKAINAEMERQKTAQLQTAAGKLNTKNLSSLSEQEIQTSITAAKQLAASMKPTEDGYKRLVDNIIRAEEHIKQFGLEGERSARQASQQMQTMVDRMGKLATLSDGALAETKKFWETQLVGAERGSAEAQKYEAHIQAIVSEQERLAAEQTKTAAQGIYGDKMTMSEGAIRKAIEAAKQYRQTLAATDPEYKRLTTAIVDAEEHINKYGLEAERTARKEIEAAEKAAAERKKTDQLMQNQLQKGTALTESALKAQQQYWQRLIDDPKTASASLKQYEANLAEVKRLQEQMASSSVATKGQAALQFFRGDTSNASAAQIKEQQQALIAYRDSLPRQDQAAVIAEINSYIEKTGTAAKVAAGEVMSLADAEALAGQLGTKGFAASTDQLKQAKKALEEARDAAGRGTKEFSKYQAAINKVDLELAKTGELSAEVKAVLDSPKGKSFNELKQAVEQGRQALANMRTETEKDKKDFDELATKVKAADFEMKALGNSSKGTATAFDKAWSRLKTYIGLYMGAAVAIQKLVGAMGDLMELSDKMGEVRKTTGFTADEVGRLSDSLAKLDTRTPIQELLGLSAAAGQLGLKTQEDIRGFTEAANQLIVALPEMGRESATSLMKIANATGDLERNGGDVEETLQRVGSTIIALRANSASAAPAITDFVSRVGAVGAQAGITIDQIAAMGSTIDALGGRVEMSATALSRMIPAIRNNSFAVANAIGVTESYLKSLSAMDQLVLVFRKMRDSIKGIDTSTEAGMNQMADNVEALLSKNATMAEVMKELNQQGARAGIVFGLMSQNVDELSRQLVTAEKAYEDNMALMNEYNNMNETTAAKWARLKNTFEEMFVGDSMQRFLGGIIDGLHTIVRLIDGPLHGAFVTLSLTFVSFRLGIGEALVALKDYFLNLGTNIKKLITWFRALSTANVWVAGITAAVTAVAMLVKWLKSAKDAAQEVTKAMEEAEAQFAVTERSVGDLFHRLRETDIKTKELAKNTKDLKKEEKALQEEVDELAKKLGKGAEESEEFKKKQAELEEAHKKVATAEGEAAHQTERRMGYIAEINSKYSTYLGYMLSEASTAETVASAHDLIVASLKEEMYWREQNNAFENVRKRHEEKLSEYRKDSFEELDYLNPKQQQDIMADWQRVLSSIEYNNEKAAYKYNGKLYSDQKALLEDLKNTLFTVLKDNNALQVAVGGKTKLNDIWGRMDDGFKDWSRESLNVLKETAMQQSLAGASAEEAHKKTIEEAKANTKALIEQGQKRGDKVSNTQLAEAVAGIQKNISKNGELKNDFKQFAKDTTIQGIANVLLKDLPEETRKAVVEEAGKIAKVTPAPAAPIKPTNDTNPYGDYNKVTSPYGDWNASDLVNRRKEMLERVKALANGADVQAVLSEDAKFISEATRKNIKDTKQAIEWYNTERLKIQDALHEKHLTNSGDWKDPKKGGKKASKMVQDEMKYYLDELDAYYTERKASIQESRNDEEISEAEARNRTLANEAEWHQRRANLQKLYSRKRKEVADEEEQAIFDIISERTGDTTDYIKEDIKHTVKFIEKVGSEKGKAAMDKIIGDIDLGMEKDFLRQRNAIGQHLKAIEDIINKENPFNGIVKNLQDNLGKMDVLLADIKNKEDRTTEMETERVMFIMEQATKGYGLTWEQMMRDMAERGWQAWANAIQNDTAMQTGLMHQVTKVFESIQDAIRKEASQIKKDAEVMWNNILLPGGDGRTTVKDAFEQSIALLGIQEGRVSRANSLIGAGQASERVADKLAIQQLNVQLAMQQYQYNLMRKQGHEKIAMLRKEAKMYEDIGDMEKARALRMQADNAAQALNLATRKEQTEELKLQEQIIAKTEESQNKLYKELKSWADLFTSSLQSIFEASNTGQEQYYNDLAKMRLTGEGSAGGTYIVIDNAGTSDAEAHYEYLSGEEALRRQLEIEQQNATAEAWKKVMDDLNAKINDFITDQMNAWFENKFVNANTEALGLNTAAIVGLTEQIGGNADTSSVGPYASGYQFRPGYENVGATDMGVEGISPLQPAETPASDQPWKNNWNFSEDQGGWNPATMSWDTQIEQNNLLTDTIVENSKTQVAATVDATKKMTKSTQASFASMTQAANLYGIAYQAMSNDNLSTAQKFELIAVQAAGQAAIQALTAGFAQATGMSIGFSPLVLSQCWGTLGPILGPIAYGLFSGTLGGLMGLAASAIMKSKSEIAQATGAKASAGRLSTGMLTYAEGNVNEFTDPDTLTPGKSYNVDAADGKTYRAKYTGRNPRTHITNGPEFHLAGEAGREMIIDAGTTRQITMNDREIFRAIQTISNGGRLRRSSSRRGVGAFADGNLYDFENGIADAQSLPSNGTGMSLEMASSLQQSIDRNNELLDRALKNGIKGVFDVYGKGGLVDSYDTGKKTVIRYGQRY